MESIADALLTESTQREIVAVKNLRSGTEMEREVLGLTATHSPPMISFGLNYLAKGSFRGAIWTISGLV